MSHHSDLIDTTEMYLRTVYELEEEGVVPLRARIAERLGQSGPTVSQTVARMERDGLLHVADDRHLRAHREGPPRGDRRDAQAPARRAAAGRRHRPGLGGRAHRGLPVGARHERGRRAAHRRDARQAAGLPARQPDPRTGRPRPAVRAPPTTTPGLVTLSTAGQTEPEGIVEVERISEQLQPDADDDAPARPTPACGPAHCVKVAANADGVEVWTGGERVPLRPARRRSRVRPRRYRPPPGRPAVRSDTIDRADAAR